MKRFILSVLCIAVFFIGLGGLIDKARAAFKSDEKALELLKKARQAVGGETAVNGVKSMTIIGKATKTFEVEGAAKTDQGEMELNFELPNQMSKRLKIGAGDGDALAEKRFDVVVMKDGDANAQFRTEGDQTTGVRRIIVKKPDGTTEEIKPGDKQPMIIERDNKDSDEIKTVSVDGQKVMIRKVEADGGGENFRSNELFRTTLSLLLTAPEGLDVSYTYAGEGSVDGNSCDIIAANDGGSTIKLYLDKSTNLPRMMTFQAPKPFIVKFTKDTPGTEVNGETKIFTRRMEQPEMADFQVKFSDFRSVNGLQLPFKWTQTVGGKDDETLDITSYEINPANIADKFKSEPAKIFIRTKKDQ